jgi:hypothetical protein
MTHLASGALSGLTAPKQTSSVRKHEDALGTEHRRRRALID